MSSKFVRFACVFALLLCVPAISEAQRKTKKEIAAEKAAQAEASEFYKQAKAAEAEGNLEEAANLYRAAFDKYPDAGLMFLLGDTLRKAGKDDEAVEAWNKYIEIVEPQIESLSSEEQKATLQENVDRAKERIEKVKTDIERQKKEDAEAAERQRIATEEAQKKEEARKAAEAAKLPIAVNGVFMGGADQNLSVFGRAMAGGLLRFGKFAPEAHVGFEVFFRTGDAGIRAQSLTVLDLGFRYSLGDEKFKGPYILAGGGFGLFVGKPREVKLSGDSTSCAGYAGGNCGFEVDKQVTGRLGFGYGFSSSEKTTVGVRVDLTYWGYSVAGEQPPSAPPAGAIEKPQNAFAVTLGIDFLRWL